MVALVGGRIRLLSLRVVTRDRTGVQAKVRAALALDARARSELLQSTSPDCCEGMSGAMVQITRSSCEGCYNTRKVARGVGAVG